MHSSTLLTKPAYDGYLRYGLVSPNAPAALNLKQATTENTYLSTRCRERKSLQLLLTSLVSGGLARIAVSEMGGTAFDILDDWRGYFNARVLVDSARSAYRSQ